MKHARCEKITYASSVDARRAVKKGAPGRPYQCGWCGEYHLTTQTGAQARARRKLIRQAKGAQACQ